MSKDQSCPAGAGAGSVFASGGVAVGWFDGVVMVFGKVERLQPPKCKSSATKVPVIVFSCSKSLQSPPAEMWMSADGAVLSS